MYVHCMYDCMGRCISCAVASLLAVCLLLARLGKMQVGVSNECGPWLQGPMLACAFSCPKFGVFTITVWFVGRRVNISILFFFMQRYVFFFF